MINLSWFRQVEMKSIVKKKIIQHETVSLESILSSVIKEQSTYGKIDVSKKLFKLVNEGNFPYENIPFLFWYVAFLEKKM